MSNDLGDMFAADEVMRRWTAERENASARLELARAARCRAYLLSQHEPVATLGINRDDLRVLMHFLAHGDESRLKREVAARVAVKLGATP